MTPLFFGSSARRLFGIYTPARGRAARARSFVLCQPWGQEYLRAHRAVRQLGNLLSSAGHHVFRFDYFGTGDSGGDMLEADLAGWEADIETAMQELMDTTGATRVSLVGLRLGALLAARVASRRRREVDVLGLWDPVVNGAEHLTELMQSDVRNARKSGHCQARPAEQGGGHEIRGFPLTDRFAEEIRVLDLPALVPGLPTRTFVVASAPLASHDALKSALMARPNGETAFEPVESPSAWLNHQNLGAGAIPAKLLDRFVRLVG